jgi:hypothetical protein
VNPSSTTKKPTKARAIKRERGGEKEKKERKEREKFVKVGRGE